MDDHSSGTRLAARLVQPTRMIRPGGGPGASASSSLFGFAPGGVCRAASVARRAVRSYRTLSPLPRLQIQDLSTGRFAFCGTFPGVTPAGRYPAPCFHGARTFLSAITVRNTLPAPRSGHPANWLAKNKGIPRLQVKCGASGLIAGLQRKNRLRSEGLAARGDICLNLLDRIPRKSHQ